MCFATHRYQVIIAADMRWHQARKSGIAVKPIHALAEAACSTHCGLWRVRKIAMCTVPAADDCMMVWSFWLIEREGERNER